MDLLLEILDHLFLSAAKSSRSDVVWTSFSRTKLVFSFSFAPLIFKLLHISKWSITNYAIALKETLNQKQKMIFK